MLDTLTARLAEVPRFEIHGRTTRVVGLVVEATGVDMALGELCRIRSTRGESTVLAEVVGFHERGVLLMPLGELDRVHAGSVAAALGGSLGGDVSPGMPQPLLNGVGQSNIRQWPLPDTRRVSMMAEPPRPLEREVISEPLETGVRAIDGVLTMGRGQRIGIFAGSGVGKSTLLGMIARHASADVNVIALLGERGREVRDFIESALGPEGLARA